jgi:hypothetical protein
LGVSRAQEIRRRSDEIKYWRESYNPGFRSPPSSNAPAEAETDREADQDRDDAKSGLVDESMPQSPVDADTQAQQLPPRTPPQPFNFEAITRDMAGMKITHAASMDSRIGGLEACMARLERVIDQLCHAVPGFKSSVTEVPLPAPASDPSSFSFAFTTDSAPPTIPALYQTKASELGTTHEQPLAADGDPLRHSSHFSFGETQTYISSLYPPSSSATGPHSLTGTAPTFNPSNRPISNATVRAATSLPALGRDGAPDSCENDRTAALVSQVEAERAARQDLEAQVAKLSQRLNTLSATMYALVRSDGGLAKARSQDQLRQPPTPKQQSPAQAKSVPVLAPAPPLHKQATLSAFDAAEDDAEDRQTEEEFLTPGEERSTLGGYGFGSFGEPVRTEEERMEEEDDDDDDVTENEREEDDDEGKRRKAARTLSLSQLTLGKKGGRAVQI